jgi:hypothetical protein
MKDVYVRAKREANYTAGYFLTMLSNYGGLGTAHRLLASSEVSTGFTALFERGRLDLTVEALVMKPAFAGLFTEDEVDTARQRLRQLAAVLSAAVVKDPGWDVILLAQQSRPLLSMRWFASRELVGAEIISGTGNQPSRPPLCCPFMRP